MQIIVQIVQHLKPGGIEKLAIDIMKYRQQGTQVFVVALEGDMDTCVTRWPELAEHQEQLIFINKPTGFKFSTVLQLRTWIKKLKATCIHTHHIGPLLYGGLASLGLKGLKHIHTEHDAWHLSSPKQQYITRLMLKLKSILLVADAKTVAGELPKYLGRLKRLDTILNGIDTEKFKPSLTVSRDWDVDSPIIIGCAARLVPEKSLSILITSIADIDNCCLNIAGDGPEKPSLMALVDELNIVSKVNFIGHTDEMVSFYQSLDIFVLTSQYEGLPLSLLEAQSCGIPVICSDVGAVWEGVCDITGILVSEHNPHAFNVALKNKIQQITNVSSTTNTNPREFIVSRFDINNMINAYNNLN